jgi:hypothetical protein
VSTPDADKDRHRRVLRLRTAWRSGASEPDASGDFAENEAASDQRAETLDSNDRIRQEAPDDLETRRQADQLEREVKRRGSADKADSL